MTRARGGVASGPIIILAAVLAAVIACGCSRRARFVRHEVQGTVRLEGQPVPAGEVVFEPDAAAGNVGPQGRAEILSGRFQTWPDQGAIAGPTIVRVQAYDGIPHRENPRGCLVGPAADIRLVLPPRPSTLDLDAVAP